MNENTIHAQSGHTLFIEKVKFEDLPANVQDFEYIKGCTGYRIVKNWDKEGVTFMYIAKTKGQYLVWYRGGGFWSGYGKTIQEAIDGAQKAGWMYA